MQIRSISISVYFRNKEFFKTYITLNANTTIFQFPLLLLTACIALAG